MVDPLSRLALVDQIRYSTLDKEIGQWPIRTKENRGKSKIRWALFVTTHYNSKTPDTPEKGLNQIKVRLRCNLSECLEIRMASPHLPQVKYICELCSHFPLCSKGNANPEIVCFP